MRNWWRRPSSGSLPSPPPRRPGQDVSRPSSGTDALSPGTVDVRLLTMTPRLDGLRNDLPPNRARRAVELVAYLALHQPDVVTSDRLRTRVLGSSDADAAAKTLFNTAYAARRAMGLDEEGNPLFPTGSRDGLYQLSSQVTVDVERAVALCAEAKAQSDPAAAIALLPRCADAGRGRATGQRIVGVRLVGGRGTRRADRRRTGRCRLPHGPTGLRQGALRSRPLGTGASSVRRALQRGPLPGGHAGRGRRRGRRSPPPGVARLPTPDRRPRPGRVAVGAYGIPVRRAVPSGSCRCHAGRRGGCHLCAELRRQETDDSTARNRRPPNTAGPRPPGAPPCFP